MGEWNDKVEKLLRTGKPIEALAATEKWIGQSGASRETAIDVAKSAALVYRDLIAEPVHVFAEKAETALQEPVGGTVAKALGRLIKMSEHWEDKLWAIHTERLTREIRDWTRQRHYDAATSNVARLMALVSEKQRTRRAIFIGNVLGSLINNQKEAEKLISVLVKNAKDCFLDADLVMKMNEARENRAHEMMKANMETIELEWSRQLVEEAVEIKNALPAEGKMGEPTEDELRDAGDIFRSIMRVPIWREEPDLFLDGTLLLVDFVPKEQSQTAKAAMVEGRTYNTLGFTAKKAVMLSFQELGKNTFFTSLYQEWAKAYMGTDAIRPIVEFMGAMRTTAFNDFLKKAAGKGRSAVTQARVDDALGSIAGEEAIETLISDLKSLMRKKHLELSEQRKAEAIFSALGKIIRSPRTASDTHRYILEQVKSNIPENLGRMALAAALECFVPKHSEQSDSQREWAIRVLARSLWLSDQTTEHHKGGERQDSELGFRHRIAEGLKKLAPQHLNVLHQAIEPLCARYGSAYIAVAEVLEKTGDDDSIQILERMLNSALMHDDSETNEYQKEYYWDAAAQERKPLTKEKVISPLVYAIGAIGGHIAAEALKRYRDQISSGRVAAPTGEVATFMEQFLGKDAFVAPAKPADDGDGEPARYNEAEAKALIKQLRGGYLLSGKNKRRMKKIEALTKLAQTTPLEAMDDIFDHLADKDIMVSSAAITCLTEYAASGQKKTVRDLTIDMMLERLDTRDAAMRKGAAKLLKEIGPGRKDVKDKLVVFAKTIDSDDVKKTLAETLRTAKSSPAKEALGAMGEPESQADLAVNKIELKREYMEARRAWISGGKRGDEPPKPPGLE